MAQRTSATQVNPLKFLFQIVTGVFVLIVVLGTIALGAGTHHGSSAGEPATTVTTLPAAHTTTTAPPSIDASTLSQLKSDVQQSAADDGTQIKGVQVSGSQVVIETTLYRKDGNVETAMGLCNTANVDLRGANIDDPTVFVRSGVDEDIAYSMPASSDHPDGYCKPSYGLHVSP